MKLFRSANTALIEALNASHAVVEMDAKGTITQANERFCDAIGFTQHELSGRSLQALLSAAGEKEDFLPLSELREGRHCSRVFRCTAKSKSELWLEASYMPVTGRGSSFRIVALIKDVTDRANQQAEEPGKLAAISQSQAVIEFLPDGTIISANQNFCNALNYRLDEIVGRHHSMFCSPSYTQSDEYRMFWKRLAEGEFFANEFLRIGKGGKEVWIQATYNPIPDAEGKVAKVVKFATDVTERMGAIGELGLALKEMSNGNLSTTLDRPFVPTMEALRHDFNKASATLSKAMTTVGQRSQTISDGARRMDVAAADLARRSEQQAASVEETAATLEEITTAVAQSSERASDAAALASSTRDETNVSLDVVEQAVRAMKAIQQSASDISNIIAVIDDIAFQTNLLALNAGVEAARAGESGRGFAVVAQEVRSLAQRSAESAKEIKALINRSDREVVEGVAKVNETGQSIRGIAAKIATISANLHEIVQSAKEQTAGVREVSNTVVRMDSATQENASLADTSATISSELSAEAEELFGLLGRFRLSDAQTRGFAKAA